MFYVILIALLSQLTDDQVKEKRKQRLAKAGYDARVRARKEKEKEREAKEEEERWEQREREVDPTAWATRVRLEHTVRDISDLHGIRVPNLKLIDHS